MGALVTTSELNVAIEALRGPAEHESQHAWMAATPAMCALGLLKRLRDERGVLRQIRADIDVFDDEEPEDCIQGLYHESAADLLHTIRDRLTGERTDHLPISALQG